MSRIAFLTRVFAFSQVVPPSDRAPGVVPPVYFWIRSSRSTGTNSLSSP
jgi:hypothetical protein